MSDEDKALVEWLREENEWTNQRPYFHAHAKSLKAATRIEAQAAEIEKLRDALEYYADRDNQCPNKGPWGVDSLDFGLVALKALKALGKTK